MVLNENHLFYDPFWRIGDGGGKPLARWVMMA
jgi:hypothetical protein